MSDLDRRDAEESAKLVDQLRPAVLGVLVLTRLTGILFLPLFFALGRPLFPHQAQGSLVTRRILRQSSPDG